MQGSEEMKLLTQIMNPFPNDKFSTLPNLKFDKHDGNFSKRVEKHCGKRRNCLLRLKWQKVVQMGRKHCGKRRNCSSRAISPFPTAFSEDLYCRHLKIPAGFGNG